MTRAVAIKPFKPAEKSQSTQTRFARGNPKHKAGEMNPTERAYAEMLEMKQGIGEILWFKYEAMNFKLADKTYYKPDFAVMLADGTLEMHEVKGFWQDAARIKIKIAAATFPIVFKAFKKRAKKHGGGWSVEVIGDPQPKGAA